MFPIKKQFISTNNTEHGFLSSYDNHAEIPLLPHPGAFAKVRKNHCHEGVDLYCNKGDEVYSMFAGKVLAIIKFTGEHEGSPWWNNTWSILVEHEKFVINYGEIEPNPSIVEGMLIEEGTCLGKVLTVLKEDKGRPMNMLHLEMYEPGTLKHLKSWDLNQEKPANLLDPTPLLLKSLTH
jgi:murein DD-endopeptidase MepM/ murein hydrolase activator NlpD